MKGMTKRLFALLLALLLCVSQFPAALAEGPADAEAPIGPETDPAETLVVHISNYYCTNGEAEQGSVITVEAGQELKLTAEEKEGLSFGGWYTGTDMDEDGFPTFYGNLLCATAEYTFTPTEDVWLVAMYQRIQTSIAVVRIFYYFTDTGFEHYCTGATAIGSELTETAPEKEGYTFVGWYRVTEWDGNNEPTAYGELLCDTPAYTYTLTENISIVAVYEKNETPAVTVHITYAYYDAEGYSEHSDAVTVAAGQELTLTAEEEEGYNFFGWYAGVNPEDGYPTENPELLSETAEYTFTPTEDVWLVAMYQRIQTSIAVVRIFYYYSDTGYEHSCTGATAIGSELTETAPEKEGYTFVGWYRVTEWDGNNEPTAYGELLCDTPAYTYTLTENMSIVAVYEKNESASVTVYISVYYNTYETYTEHGSLETVEAGQELTLTAEEKEGYSFIGWFTGTEPDEEGYPTDYDELLCETAKYTFTPTEDVRLIAMYQKIYTNLAKINIFYYYSDTGLEWYTWGVVAAGQELTLTAEEKEGYSFAGWYRGTELDENGQPTEFEELLCETAEYSFIAEDICLVQAYEKIETPNVLASGQCGDELFWTLYQSGTMVINGIGDMWDYNYENGLVHTWRDYIERITAIVVEPGATSIGEQAFISCFRAEEISIPGGITRIGDNAFDGCWSLSDLTLPGSLTSIGRGAFYDCRALTSVTIPANVTVIEEGAFLACRSLSEIRFLGSAPMIAEEYTFGGVIATAYYPGNDPSWTREVRQDYSGCITWIPYGLTVDAGLVIGGGRARVGEEIQIPVRIENNPGLVSIELNVHYEAWNLEWIGVTEGELGGNFNAEVGNPVTWSAEDPSVNETRDGVLCILTFRVEENSQDDRTRVGVSYDEDKVRNEAGEYPLLRVTPGTVEIVSYLPGDINGDGNVSIADVVRLAQYVKARGVGVEIVPNSGNVDGSADGKITLADVSLLAKYVKARGQGVIIY